MLAELIPLALVVALSPLSIIPAVLVLSTPRPKPTGLAFMVGWILGLGALTAVFIAASSLSGGLDKAPGWASWLRVAIGVALIAFGGYKLLNRTAAEHTPKWMSSLTTIAPPRAFLTAVILIVVNPKVLFICAAAGFAIGTEGLGPTGAALAALYYVVSAGSTVIVPVVAYLVSGDRLDQPLARLRKWMERQHAVLLAIILVVIGLLVLYKGLHGL